MEENVNYSTFEGLRPHFDALARVGYFKIVLKPMSHMKRYLHEVYRLASWVLVLTYNLQHLIRVVQVRNTPKVYLLASTTSTKTFYKT